MQCFSPVSAWQTVDGGIVFVERGKNLLREIALRCGQCIGCRLNAANAWAVRCVHEASCHEFNSFVTLTYDEEHLPQHGSLNYTDFQKFMKRLRKRIGTPVRFYMCGEYGETFSRPHYHALLFGCRFVDSRQSNSVYSKAPIYRSETLEKLWPFGMSSIGEVNMATASYVAKYTLKKVYGSKADDHYKRVIPETGEIISLMPEFSRMSLKPGIGFRWLEQYGSDVWNWDNIVIDGKVMPVPRYYDKVIAVMNPERSEEIEFERSVKRQDGASDNSAARLAVKEKVAAAKVEFYSQRKL